MRRWNSNDDKTQDLWLFTPAEFEQLPYGTMLECIDNSQSIKGIDVIDDDTRYGHMAYGVRNPFEHEHKLLFLTFALTQ